MTKENYQDAIMRMYDFCISSNHPAQIREQFTQDLDFLAKLAEEHFEEKAETNYEHFKDEIVQNVKYNLAVVNGEPKPCEDTNCDECDFNCDCCGEKRFEWLASPYKKPTYKLTQFEYDLLQHFSVDFKFKEMGLLKEMKEKGHFKNINGDELIKDILESCEVIK
jgi:hypothetical protein